MSAGSRNAHFAVTTERSAHAHALPPALLGLLAPMVVFLLIDPRAIADASLIAHVYMVAIFIIASIAYFISVFETLSRPACSPTGQAKRLRSKKPDCLRVLNSKFHSLMSRACVWIRATMTTAIIHPCRCSF